MNSSFDETKQFRIARQRFGGEPDVDARDRFAAMIVDRAGWLTSQEGRASLTDKGTHSIGVAAGMVQSVLELAVEEGMSPLQVLEIALRHFSATMDSECAEVVLVEACLKMALDKAGSRQ